ncbi:MAG: ribonuclease H-like YkuK family protein [Bacillota bacterium]
MVFISPTKGSLSFEGMFKDLMEYMNESPGSTYKVIVGTDSHNKDEVTFVTAVIIHRLGKGARYYYTKKRDRKMISLRQRMFYEASLSLGVAGRLAEKMAHSHADLAGLEIHLDVGEKGDTKDIVREIVGMVMGSGFDARIKPESYGASKVADKHTK